MYIRNKNNYTILPRIHAILGEHIHNQFIMSLAYWTYEYYYKIFRHMYLY